MQKSNVIKLAIVGVGRVGRACAEAIGLSHDLKVTAFVRRPGSGIDAIPEQLRRVPVVTHMGQIIDVDAALICVPTNDVQETVSLGLRCGIPIVECATLHGDAFQAHKEAIHRLALHHKAPAIVGAGWDPGALSVFRSWFALLTPRGITETTHRPGVNLHHTTAVRAIAGVKDALCGEVRTPEGKMQRYVYVELDASAKADEVTEGIRADPLFLGVDTQVFPVESLAPLEQEGRGVVLDRRGISGALGHQHFMLEGRFDESALTAQVMLAAARALSGLEPGAHTLADVPLSALWGEQAAKAERDWL